MNEILWLEDSLPVTTDNFSMINGRQDWLRGALDAACKAKGARP
ncbi:hypothetical protein [Paraburkholderia sp. CNPSo 3272]|nr:hypothetical protein [Paraburkholderia sp. CNPSo 3272]